MECGQLDDHHESELSSINDIAVSSREIALIRIKFLQEAREGFASSFYGWLENAVVAWSESQRPNSTTELLQNTVAVQSIQEVSLLTLQEENVDDATIYTRSLDCSSSMPSQRAGRWLCHLLRLHARILQLDPVLGEELGRQGTHCLLSRLLLDLDRDCEENDDEDDVTFEIREVAFEIAARSGGTFPLRVSPFNREELLQRLPLVFDIQDVENNVCTARGETQTVLLHQVTTRQSAQEDVGFGT
jgi:hypothetical protein